MINRISLSHVIKINRKFLPASISPSVFVVLRISALNGQSGVGPYSIDSMEWQQKECPNDVSIGGV
jgi:hypothetical protein